MGGGKYTGMLAERHCALIVAIHDNVFTRFNFVNCDLHSLAVAVIGIYNVIGGLVCILYAKRCFFGNVTLADVLVGDKARAFSCCDGKLIAVEFSLCELIDGRVKHKITP